MDKMPQQLADKNVLPEPVVDGLVDAASFISVPSDPDTDASSSL
jgi:hypothetical protein